MRAVYLAIILGFLRRLLRRVLVPSGGHRKARCYVLHLGEPEVFADESMDIDKVVVGGPYYIPESELVSARYKVRVFGSHLPGDLDLYLDEIDRSCMEWGLRACAVRYGVTEEELHDVDDARTFLSRFI